MINNWRACFFTELYHWKLFKNDVAIQEWERLMALPNEEIDPEFICNSPILYEFLLYTDIISY
ncbi:MAG: hypothetical protein MZV70_46470 [Desulfobacterales bacterium]|nr:hypothetical protein [Desulfobacterales bacterium]